MGNPDGGWYDEKPPIVVGSTPKDKATFVDTKKIRISFDEFIKVDNPTENVIISPPQIEMPDIKGAGKHILINLKDSLLPNTTYTIDFSDAISDNNEGNPLGNYTYSFSTGESIDTLEVSGYVLEAENLEPIKGILVGLYSQMEDSTFRTSPMLRVARTDSRGHFVIKGIAAGSYRVYALQDADGNYLYSQKSEKIAFNHDIIIPSSKPDIRQDTIWRDTLHISDIKQVGYTHFFPDDITLRAFTPIITDRYLIKTERAEADHFTFYFSYGDEQLPQIRGLNFDEWEAFIVASNEKNDTITYWLRDTTLVNQDTLRLEVQYLMTDTLGELVSKTDTLEMLSKQPYAKRIKQRQKEYDEWAKEQEKAKKKGQPYDSIMPIPPLKMKIDAPSQLDPDKNIRLSTPCPLAVADSSMIHLYAKHDSLWYESKFLFHQLNTLEYELIGEWHPTIEYSLEIDSAAFIDIYGNVSKATKNGFGVRSEDAYSTIIITLPGMDGKSAIVQLLTNSDGVYKETKTNNGQAEFYYVKPGDYYMRMYIDENDNGKWDTGDFDQDLQPETVYYYPDVLQCKAKWDLTQSWNPTARETFRQKPEKITKQKPDKAKTVKKRNADRAKSLGIIYVEQ
ncbi:MAG: Ig-like domain-containing protein [Prevotella sp.]|nr:Ig-like domain-containing protein [Prevotella sp.]